MNNETIAYLFAFAPTDKWGVMAKRYPPELLPVANRPFLEWIIIWLSESGIRNIHIYASDNITAFSYFLGNGQRWGINISLSAVASPEKAILRLEHELQYSNGLIIDCSYLAKIKQLTIQDLPENTNHLFVDKGRTRWAMLSNNSAVSFDGVSDLDSFFGNITMSGADVKELDFISCSCSQALLEANRYILSCEAYAESIAGSQIEPKVFLEAGVVLHPTTRVESISCVGEYCAFGRGARINSGTAVGSHVIIGDMTIIENSIILPNTSLGSQLNFQDCIVDRNCLIRSGSNEAVMIPDGFIASEISSHSAIDFREWICHYILTIIALPPLLLAAAVTCLWLLLRESPQVFEHKQAISLPVEPPPELWPSFTYTEFARPQGGLLGKWLSICLVRRSPLIFKLLRGDMKWFGVAPRSAEELKNLPPDWQDLYRSSDVGFFRLAEIDSLDNSTVQEQEMISDSYYATSHTLGQKVRIFWRYLLRFFIV